jgi:hypothetical protein
MKTEIVSCIQLYNKSQLQNDKSKNKNKVIFRNKPQSPNKVSHDRLASPEQYKNVATVYGTYHSNLNSFNSRINTCSNTTNTRNNKQNSMNVSSQNMFKQKANKTNPVNIYNQLQKVANKTKQSQIIKSIKNNMLQKQIISHVDNHIKLNKSLITVLKSNILNDNEIFKFSYLNKTIYTAMNFNLSSKENEYFEKIMKYPSNLNKMSINFISNNIEEQLYQNNDINCMNLYLLWSLLMNKKTNMNDDKMNVSELYTNLYKENNVLNFKGFIFKCIFEKLFPLCKYVERRFNEQEYNNDTIQKIMNLIKEIMENNKLEVGVNKVYNYLHVFLEESLEVLEVLCNPRKFVILKNKLI